MRFVLEATPPPLKLIINNTNFTTPVSWRFMPQLINLSEFNQSEQPEFFTQDENQYQDEDITPIAVLSAKESLTLLRELFPGKLLFSIKETAEFMNVSYEFLRGKVNSGRIPYTSMGNRKMINIIAINTLIITGT